MKDICILDTRELAGGLITMRFCVWLAQSVPYPNPQGGSAYPNIASDPSTAGVLAQIQSGLIVEEVYSIIVPTSFMSSWTGSVEPYILTFLNSRKMYKTGTCPSLPDYGAKLGVLHDDTMGWSG